MAATVQSMCQYWKNFDLAELQKELDVSATELAAKQDLSEFNRKKLVDQSKEFKKSTPEETRKVVSPLLKCFQAEIDSLSKRSKNAEAAFLSIYKKLIDLPDPVSALEQAQQYQKKAQRADDLELENRKLRETLDEYNNEFAEVKNQEVTIKQLQGKIKDFEEKMENNAQLRAKEKEKELQRQFAEKERQLQETQMSVAKKLGEAEHKVATLQSALESVQSELFDLRSKHDEATSAKSDEMEMIMSDMERASERAISSEREAEKLRQQLATATQHMQHADSSAKTTDMEQAIDILKRSSLEVELTAKEKEVSQLVEDVQKLQASLNKLRETTSTQIAHLEEELSNKTRAFHKLEERIRNQADYEEIKRELSIMKSIEFSSEQSNAEGSDSKAKTLEVLLLEKNKSLQTENTQLKVGNNDVNGGPLSQDEHSSENGISNCKIQQQKPERTGSSSHSQDEIQQQKLERTGSSSHSQDIIQQQRPERTSSSSHSQDILNSSRDEEEGYSSAEEADVGQDDGVSPMKTELHSKDLLSPSVHHEDRGEMNSKRHTESVPNATTPKLSPRLNSSSSSSSSSAPPTPIIPPLHGSAELFASMIGQELAASYHLHNPNHFIRLENGHIIPRIPVSLQVPMPNGFHPHPELMKRLQPNSPPMGQLGSNGSQIPSSIFESAKLNRHLIDVKVEPNNGQILDTADVALRIREILSAHNIGQRLFAKHVLGLSQGTVSELLSKPKHWDKLTEKGRESYRKMYSWASTEDNVIALKAISPKKGSQPIVNNSKQEDSATEERITQILNDAQIAMQARQNQERAQIANAMVASIYQHELAKISSTTIGQTSNSSKTSPTGSQPKNNSFPENSQMDANNRGRRPQTDSGNLTQEIVAKIYQEELLKLAIAAEKSGNFAESTMYRQELTRLADRASREKRGEEVEERPLETVERSSKVEENKENLIHNNNTIKAEPHHMKQEPGSRPHSEMSDGSSDGPQDLRVNVTAGSSGSSNSSEDPGLRHAGSAFSLVRPRSTGPPGEHSPPLLMTSSAISPTSSSSAAAASQLKVGQELAAASTGSAQQNITSDGLSPLQQMQSIANSLMAKNSLQGHPNRPLRAVLPPISQEQFDRYSTINTDELVKQVKETLSQYSISQRLFGENILGLSQGSVSDLLARPKPWHMLTQKGREPFIRMQIFLEDQEAIPKLVANQYKIAPEKLLRTNSMGDSREQVPHANTSPPPPPLLAPLTLSQSTPITIIPQMLSPPAVTVPSSSIASTSSLPLPTTSPRPSPSTPVSVNSKQLPSLPMTLHPHPMFPHLPPQFPIPHPLAFEHLQMAALQPNIFEVAAMTQELDTLLITTKVKEVLQFHNLGQKLFGEAILGLSQGSVSELLSKPKPWHMLSLKGREPFIKMHLWLNDPHNIDRLRVFQNELKANRKRRGSSEHSENGYNHKKPRVFFSDDQKELLRVSYNKDPYPSQNRIEELANHLNVGAKTIVNWFHNHRMRAKQTNGLGSPTMVPHLSSMGMKMEPSDDSNHSSTYSEPLGASQFRGRHPSAGGPIPLDASAMAAVAATVAAEQQWMFPHFEALPITKEQQESGSNDNMRQNMDSFDTDSNDKAEDLTCKPRNYNQDEDDADQDDFSPPDSGRNSPTDLSQFSHFNNREDQISEASEHLKDRVVNRRKSSKPQWVYEGMQLDRSISLDGSSSAAEDFVQNARYNKLQEQYNEAFSTITEQKQLITQLEEDLRSVNALSSMFRPDAEGEAGPPSQSAELVADAVKEVASAQSAVMTPLGVQSAADSLLPIVQSQRERFRLRAQELEAQSTAQQQQVHMLQNEMDKLRSDNVKLYEKIKFLQSYPKKGATHAMDIESRYSSQYEEKLDPFSSFNKKEKMKRYMNLKPYDKITLSAGKLIMGNPMARTAVFFYTMILHALIFMVLYKLAYSSEVDRDVSLKCHHDFAEHMANVHGDHEMDHHH